MLFKKKKDKVEFKDLPQLQYIIKPLSDKAFEVLIELLDRYVDYKMREVIKERINENSTIDSSDEVRLR